MNRTTTLIVQAALLFGVIVLPQPERAAQLEKAIVRGRAIENGFLLADVAERYAESHGGTYGATVYNYAGYLPLEQPLMNAVSQLLTEPVDGQAASGGQVGYVPINVQGYDVGYSITVFGVDNTVGPAGNGIILEIQKVTDPPPMPASVPD